MNSAEQGAVNIGEKPTVHKYNQAPKHVHGLHMMRKKHVELNFWTESSTNLKLTSNFISVTTVVEN